jgi:hypothetical protein
MMCAPVVLALSLSARFLRHPDIETDVLVRKL